MNTAKRLLAPKFIWGAAGLAFLIQLILLLLWSRTLFDHFDLQLDFAIFYQPWYLIARGNLNPISSIHGYAFIRDHLELGMWPLSVTSYIEPNGLLLLWIQDVAIVGTGVAVFGWSYALIRRHADRLGLLLQWTLLAMSMLLVMLSPAIYETASANVHLQPLGTFFLVLCGYDLWSGHHRRLFIWVPLTVLFGGVFGGYLVAIGVSALLVRSTRGRAALLVSLAGIAWLAIATGTNSEQGSSLQYNYAYLAHTTVPASTGSIIKGTILHPGTPLHILKQRWQPLWDQVAYSGLIGVLSPWGLPAALAVLIPTALNVNPSFIAATSSFGSFPAYPFIAFGSIALLVGLCVHEFKSAWLQKNIKRVVLTITVVTVALVSIFNLIDDGHLRSQWELVSPATAGTLDQVLVNTRSNVEVIAAQGIVGRFAARKSIYAILDAAQQFRIDERTIEFVITPNQGIETVPIAGLEGDIAYLQQDLKATPVVQQNGVYEFVWQPPRGQKYVVLPGTPS